MEYISPIKTEREQPTTTTKPMMDETDFQK